LIEDALGRSAGNKQKAAQTLGLSRQGLIKNLERLSVTGLSLVFGLTAIIWLT